MRPGFFFLRRWRLAWATRPGFFSPASTFSVAACAFAVVGFDVSDVAAACDEKNWEQSAVVEPMALNLQAAVVEPMNLNFHHD